MRLIIEHDNNTLTVVINNLQEFDIHKAFAKAHIAEAIHDAICEDCDLPENVPGGSWDDPKLRSV